MHKLEVEIITHMARTLFVSTYADAYDNGDLHRMAAELKGYVIDSRQDNEGTPEQAAAFYYLSPGETSETGPYDSEQEAWEAACQEAGIHIEGAGEGSDWMDVAPNEMPIACVMEAAFAVGEWLNTIRFAQKEFKFVSLYHYLKDAAIADAAQELAKVRTKGITAPERPEEWAAWIKTCEPTVEEIASVRMAFDTGADQIPFEGSRRNTTYAEDFGHCLAMMGMGHGVSWFDDHARFDLPDFSPWISGIMLEDLGFDPKSLIED